MPVKESEFNAELRGKLLNVILEQTAKGTKMKEIFKIAGKVIGMDSNKCKNQWYNKMHLKHEKEIEAAKEKFRKSQGTPNLQNVVSAAGVAIEVYSADANTSWLPVDDDRLAALALPYEGGKNGKGQKGYGKWKEISKHFPLRTTKAVENHWHLIKAKYIENAGGVTVVKEQTEEKEVVEQITMDNTPLSAKEILSQLGGIVHNFERDLKAIQKDLKAAQDRNTSLLSQNQYLHDENNRLKKSLQNQSELEAQSKTLQQQLQLVQKNYAQLSEDHKAVLKVFDMARKSVVLEEAGEQQPVTLLINKAGEVETKTKGH